jgi:hypothetical protein
VDYEKSCAACHDEKIATSVGRGVAMLSLPTLDVAAIRKAGRDIGPWPQNLTGDFDGALPPAMKLLLAGDQAAAAALSKLGAGFEFQDVDTDDDALVVASADLAVAIKRLVSDIAARGPAVVRERLSAALGREITATEAATLTAGLSGDTIRGVANWLPSVNAAATGLPVGAGETISTAESSRPIAFAAGGSWSRDDTTLTIRYRPIAHADPVLTAWLDVLARTPNLNARPVAAAMFKELTKSTSPGLCASCHSVENATSGTMMVNWTANDRSTEVRTFTKFTHGPHLVLPQLENCTSCHAVNDATSVTAAYFGFDPYQFTSDFKPMAKQQCAECHTPRAAGDACQSCHNYHVQMAEEWRLKPSLNERERQARRLRISDFGFRIEEPDLKSEIH